MSRIFVYNTLYKLKSMLQLCLITAVITVISSTSVAEVKQYTVGIVPQFETNRLYKIWRPILDELEQRTGLRFTLKGSTNIPDFENEFMSGSFDFAYMNPYHIMMASESEGYIPLVRDVGRTLNGVLVVRKDNAIRTVKELNHKKVAFPSPNAVGASLLAVTCGLTALHRCHSSPARRFSTQIERLSVSTGTRRAQPVTEDRVPRLETARVKRGWNDCSMPTPKTAFPILRRSLITGATCVFHQILHPNGPIN